MTVFASMDEYDQQGPKVRTIWGHEISLESAESDLERMQDKIDVYVAELNKQHDSATRRRLRNRLDALEREHDFLWRQCHPAYIDGQGYVGDGPDLGDTVECKAAECQHRLTKSLAFQTLGFCPGHFRRAVSPTTAEGMI
jgi:hypothetical protein